MSRYQFIYPFAIRIMALLENVIIILIFFLVLFAILYARSRRENEELLYQISDITSRKQSLSTKYGRMTEQFMPFMADYPYNAEAFRFIGSPIDGVQFEKDKIVFIEFKAGNHPISNVQREVKDLITQGKVEFKEIRIK